MVDAIYVDVLIAVNLFVNYFLLLSTAKFVHFKPRKIRMLASAFASSLFSLLIFLDTLSFLFMLVIKLVLALVLILIAFGKQERPVFIKMGLTFFGVNFVFAGSMFAMWTIFKPAGMYYQNGSVYFNISAVTLIISTIAAYLVIVLISYIMDKRVKSDEIYTIEVEVDHRQTIINGFFDTGNSLIESFSGLPVVVCQFDSIKDIIPAELHSVFRNQNAYQLEQITYHRWRNKIRVIPYNVVGGEGILLAFRPDRFCIIKKHAKIRKDVYIAVTFQKLSQGEYNTILNSKIRV